MKNFFDRLEKKAKQYKDVYFDKPHKAALHMIMWCLKSIFKKWDVSNEIITKDNNCIKNAVLFNLQGGLGDILIAINYLVQLKAKFDKKIIFYATLPDEMKSAVKFIDDSGCIKLADATLLNKKWALNVDLCRIPYVRAVNFDNLKKISEPLCEWAREISDFNNKYSEYLKSGTVNDYLLTKFTQINGRNRLAQADVNNFVKVKDVYKLKISGEQAVLQDYGLNKCRYITLQCGTGVYSGGDVMSTREWPIEKFNGLIILIKKNYPDIKIVQVGSAKDLRMNADIDLCGVTTFDEFLAILKNAVLHIGGESGCVHMRHFMCAKPSVVLFGPTNKDFYGYKENLNISSEICPGCEWLHSGWRKFCCISGDKPECMMKLKPEFVFKQLVKII